jgi:diketogulonate reductase-like aldo/keto reductase
MDPFHQDREVRELCKVHNIVYMAYSSFGTQWQAKYNEMNPVMEDATLLSVVMYSLLSLL